MALGVLKLDVAITLTMTSLNSQIKRVFFRPPAAGTQIWFCSNESIVLKAMGRPVGLKRTLAAHIIPWPGFLAYSIYFNVLEQFVSETDIFKQITFLSNSR